jgi:hypothetical protein
VDPSAVPPFDHDGAAVHRPDDAGVFEHVDVVAELDRPAGLQDDPGGEVLGDAAQGEDGDDADEDAGSEDRLRPDEGEGDADADEQDQQNVTRPAS